MFAGTILDRSRRLPIYAVLSLRVGDDVLESRVNSKIAERRVTIEKDREHTTAMLTLQCCQLVQLLSTVLLMVCLPFQIDAAEQTGSPKLEKTRLEVGTAGSGTTSLPLFVALEAGYFAKRGLNVSVNQVGATVAVQGVISGTIDIYQGGTAAIAANLAGADIIYVAAAVDRNSLILLGKRGLALSRVYAVNRLRRHFLERSAKLPCV